MPTTPSSILRADEGETTRLRALGVRFMIDGATTSGRFSLVESPLAARALGAPLHAHSREDEYSFILEGRFGMQLGDDVLEAGPGDLVFKPRGVAHTFWNAGDEPARLLEIISPAGFEDYFREMGLLFAAPELDNPAVADVRARYGLDVDVASVPLLAERHGLRLG